MSIEKLIERIAPPEFPQNTPGDWNLIFENIGTKLPSDYVDFISLYGSGLFGGFYIVLNPFADCESHNFEIRLQTFNDSLFSDYHWFLDENLEIYPKANGLLPCMYDQNGNDYFWLTKGDPEEWSILQCEHRGEGCTIHNDNLTSFLNGIFDKRIEPLASHYPNEKSLKFSLFNQVQLDEI